MIFQKALHRVRVETNILPEWVGYNLKNDANAHRLNDYFTGSTIKHFTGKAIAGYMILLPPLDEQQEIVRRVQSLFKFADKMEQRYKKTKEHTDKLTQSILAKAFRGEL